MNIPTIQIEPDVARRAFLEYKRSVEEAANREISDYETRSSKRRAELEETDKALMAGYRLLSTHKRVIVLSDVLRQGGVDAHNRPKLAVARADERQIALWVSPNGTTTYRPMVDRWAKGESAPRENNPDVSRRVFEFDELLPPTRANVQAKSDVPFIPPGIRPNRLDRYAILWEATWQSVPVDPALLRPLGQGMYAVVATWDLTPLEAAVLGAR